MEVIFHEARIDTKLRWWKGGGGANYLHMLRIEPDYKCWYLYHKLLVKSDIPTIFNKKDKSWQWSA